MRFEYLQCVSVQVTSLRGQRSEVSSLFQLRVLETELKLSGLHGKSMSVGTGIWEGVRKVESPTWDRLCRSTALRSSGFLYSLWTNGESTGALEYSTIPLSVWGGQAVASTWRDFPKDSESSHPPVPGPFWGSASLLESSISCHMVSQWTRALVLLGLCGSLPHHPPGPT